MGTFAGNFADLCDELRCWDTARVRAERERVIFEQRRLRARELACTRVLDERRALAADQAARDGVTETAARQALETARKLEQLPHLGAAAVNGALSAEQLTPAVELADERTDAQVAESAWRTSPVDLARMARDRRQATRAESMRRRERRRMWKRRDDDGFLRGGFELPMEHGGAVVEAYFDRAAEHQRPAKGERWAPLEHRHADALITLCEADTTAEDTPHATVGARIDVHVDVPLDGPATLGGVPLPDEWLAAVRADARVHVRVVDDAGFPIGGTSEARARSFVSEKRRRAVVRRDGRCRWPGCTRRLRLQVHHLTPASWGGTDDVSNLAAVCPHHHRMLVPHGDLVLAGNPNAPDGLALRSLG